MSTERMLAVFFFMSMIVVGCQSKSNHEKIDSIVIEVTGDGFNWYFRYPGPDGELGTKDDKYSTQDLYLPDNADVKLILQSKDYVYTFRIPALNQKEVAVPGLSFGLQFRTTDEQTVELLGDQFCGFSHESLIGDVHVRDQSFSAFYDWE